jgi:TRAP-type uncharacterized transport system fused permease subunit
MKKMPLRYNGAMNNLFRTLQKSLECLLGIGLGALAFCGIAIGYVALAGGQFTLSPKVVGLDTSDVMFALVLIVLGLLSLANLFLLYQDD